tara:strand:+ start:85 stop:726 length:642 start_codon:yes stop_codon:yes gene_type:complete
MLLIKTKEGMINPLIPPEYEFAILTAPQEVMSGYFQEELCRNDPKWKSGDMKCHHILDKDDCSLQGDNGVLANDVCLIACDTCPSSVTIKNRQDVGDEFSVRGINLEESDEYDYLEIYDKFQRIDDDIEIIIDIFDELRSYEDHYLDMSKCIDCFYDEYRGIAGIISATQGSNYLESCPPSCRLFADCFLDSEGEKPADCSFPEDSVTSPGSN